MCCGVPQGPGGRIVAYTEEVRQAMRRWQCLSAGSILAVVALSTAAPVVTFNEPAEWLTQRSSRIVAKVQLDTAQIKSKQVQMALSVVAGGKKQMVSRKSFKADDFSKEFDLGTVGKSLVGGYDYLSIEWSIPGAKETGTCAPVGLVELEKMPRAQVLQARKLAAGMAGAAVAAGLQVGDFVKVGGAEVAFGWNAAGLWVVCRKAGVPADKHVLLCLDGKNGKNAFLSYPDRLFRCFPQRDSVYAFHYQRALNNNVVTYTEALWNNESTVQATSDAIVISIKWHDIGVLPVDERAIGLAAFVVDAAGKASAALPAGSLTVVPGTWADLVLGK
jgi:hypothetical protein